MIIRLLTYSIFSIIMLKHAIDHLHICKFLVVSQHVSDVDVTSPTRSSHHTSHVSDISRYFYDSDVTVS